MHNENQPEVVRGDPLEGVRVLLVVLPISPGLHTLLNQHVADEAVDDAGVHGCVFLRPQEDTGGGDDLEGVQGGPGGFFGHDGYDV